MITATICIFFHLQWHLSSSWQNSDAPEPISMECLEFSRDYRKGRFSDILVECASGLWCNFYSIFFYWLSCGRNLSEKNGPWKRSSCNLRIVMFRWASLMIMLSNYFSESWIYFPSISCNTQPTIYSEAYGT